MAQENYETAVFAGGCFWCTEAVFQRLNGVEKVISGYTGGTIKNPAYREICTGRTGHAEAIQITFDPDRISFEELLEVFFATHDPTTLNRQGNDVGTQYRSEIFYQNEEQKQAAEKFIAFLEDKNVFEQPIVTAVSEAVIFYHAEEDHQNYFNDHRAQPYCQVIINPKIDKLKKYYSDKLG
ncbi:MAG: peptide-methionine (S)-S-oxide reductase MsrA [Bacteroidota bacterium]